MTDDVVSVLAGNRELIDQFIEDTEAAFLALGRVLQKPTA